MNGTSRVSSDSEPEGLDPALLRLFDEAAAPREESPFVEAILLKLQAQRRAQLARRCIAVLVILLLGALAAPYAARATLLLASWFTTGLPASSLTLTSPLPWAFAALIAWRSLTGSRR